MDGGWLMRTAANRLRVGVIGVGHLGQAHARILAGMPNVQLAGVVDANPAQAAEVATRHGTRAFPDAHALMSAVDAACVVVPTSLHRAVAEPYLAAGVPLLVEKPLAPTVEDAEALVSLARRTGTVLQVGHIERFNPAFEELRRRPIQPKLVECERHGPFTGRSMDIGAVLDLMIHDLDLLLTLVGSDVAEVDAIGVAVFGRHEDIVNARLRFADGCVAHLTASRVSPNAKRRLRIWAPEGYAGVDFVSRRLTLVQPSDELLRLRGTDIAEMDPAARASLKEQVFGRVLQVQDEVCEAGDQLTRELEDFVASVRTGRSPRVPGEAGRDAIALAARILDSLRRHPWTGEADGPCGPTNMPPPLGRLFDGDAPRRAAA
jgi:predicted dehydrogenase